ncbi:hypothetical protein HDE_03034 [Halotydeus destructor]|nr:hypothetical protein HDE_03034 [Halotydeus destructor]
MSPRAPFLTATDYVFYLRRQVDKEQLETEFGHSQDGGKENMYNSTSIEMPRLSDLLHKLSDDLKAAPQGFVDDFGNETNNGISCLLDILRISLNRQQCPGMVFSNYTAEGNAITTARKQLKSRDKQNLLKKAMTDEYDCLVCLKQAAQRSPDRTLQRILSHRNGLSTLASCIVSNFTKSRIIALQLLTNVCGLEPSGSAKVLEAMSTMRIVFGESVRFKLLVSTINSASLSGFEAHALRFVNELLSKSPNVAERVRLQCELEEAGLNVTALEKKLLDKDLAPGDHFWGELKQWNDSYIDVVDGFKRQRNMAREMAKLKENIDLLQRALTKLEEDKISLMQIERELKDRCDDYKQEVASMRALLGGKQVVPSGRRAGHKGTTGPGSDNSDPVSVMADSGRWSDSDGDGSGHHKRALGQGDQDAYGGQQNRNEDILIYIPAIKPPANFAGCYKDGDQDGSGDKVSPVKTTYAGYKTGNKEDASTPSRWRYRQRDTNSDKFSEPKPTVVEVYPKKGNNGNGVLSKSLSVTTMAHTVDSDSEDHMSLDWNVLNDKPNMVRDERIQLSVQGQSNFAGNIMKSCSNGKLDVNQYHEEGYEDMSITMADAGPQYAFGNGGDKGKRSLTHSSSLSRSLSEMSSVSNHSAGRTSDDQATGSGSTKEVRPYFFSGTVSKNSKTFKVDNNGGKVFPLPTVYKKNFITKGHGNCGMFSGVDIANNVPEPSEMTQNMSTLIHREIAMAAKDVGAWL